MAAKINVTFTGATGYIGGSVLSRFLDRPDVSSYHIRALVRSPEKAEKLKAFGVDPVVGSHSDAALVEKLASETDIFFSIADADNLEAAKATLAGLKKRHEATHAVPILIHTSGTGVLADDAAGMHTYDTIYDDSNPDQIETLPITQIHRNVDLEIINADKEGYVSTYIVLPSTIYGVATGKLVDAGIQNPASIQIPALIYASIDRGQGGMVGEGKNLWPNVHNDDIADLYLVLFEAVRTNRDKVGHGREGFYFGENGEHTLYDISKAIAQALVDLEKGKSPEPTTFTKAEIDKYFGGSSYLGSNSRCRSNRSRSIGWKPTHTTTDMLKSIKPEIEAFLKKPKERIDKL